MRAFLRTHGQRDTFVAKPTSGDHRCSILPRALAAVGLLLLAASPVRATKILLRDGRTLELPYVQVAGVAESPLNPRIPAGEVALAPLLMFDDGLRRTFIHSAHVDQVLEEALERKVRIRVWQDVAENGAGVGRIGRGGPTGPFDEFGRRVFEMQSRDGPVAIVQGITEITPVYTKVEGLMGAPRPIVWDMRMATSSIPRETLDRILKTSVPQDDADARLQVVRLYLQSERYRDAEQELQSIIADFPDRENLKREAEQLRQLGARLIFKEIELRAKAGQHQLVRSLLAKFPSEGVSGRTLEQVRELMANYEAEDRRRTALLEALKEQVALVADANNRALAEQFAEEIAAETNADALGRLASFERLAGAKELTAEQEVALAISGWLVGANQATDDFHLAVSLAEVRDMVRQYLQEPLAAERSAILAELADREGRPSSAWRSC
jgi:hypothetical protein